MKERKLLFSVLCVGFCPKVEALCCGNHVLGDCEILPRPVPLAEDTAAVTLLLSCSCWPLHRQHCSGALTWLFGNGDTMQAMTTLHISQCLHSCFQQNLSPAPSLFPTVHPHWFLFLLFWYVKQNSLHLKLVLQPCLSRGSRRDGPAPRVGAVVKGHVPRHREDTWLSPFERHLFVTLKVPL